jgi:hypothetical protein
MIAHKVNAKAISVVCHLTNINERRITYNYYRSEARSTPYTDTDPVRVAAAPNFAFPRRFAAWNAENDLSNCLA